MAENFPQDPNLQGGNTATALLERGEPPRDLGGLAAQGAAGDLQPILPSTHEQQIKEPELVWEKLEDDQNKMAHIITDLAPEVFEIYTYVPDRMETFANPGRDMTVTEDGKRRFEMGINPEKLGEQPAGTYRLRYERQGDIDFTIVEDENGNKFFDISDHVSDKEDYREDDAEYAALADPRPEEIENPFRNFLTGYFRGMTTILKNLEADKLSPTTRGFYEKVGFKPHEVDGKTRLLPPTPQTLRKLVKERNLPIRLIPKGEDGKSQIPGGKYEEAFGDELDPVGISEIIYYLHDIQDDHLPGAFPGHDFENAAQTSEVDEPTFLGMLAPLAKKLFTDGNSHGADDLDRITTEMNRMTKQIDLYKGEDAYRRHADTITGMYVKIAGIAGVVVSAEQFKVMVYKQVAKNVRNLMPDKEAAEQKAQVLDGLAASQLRSIALSEARRAEQASSPSVTGDDEDDEMI